MQDTLESQRIEVLLDMHRKQLQSEFAKLHSEVKELKEELSRIGREVRGARQEGHGQQFAAPQAPPQAQPQWQQAQQPQGWQQPTGQVQREQRPASQPIDRNGVSPADVSIEKFFYTGSNPR